MSENDGFKRNALSLDPQKLAQLTKDELYMMLTSSMWKQVTEESRLALLQEVENRQAKLDGRPPVKVCVGKMDKRLMGLHTATKDGQEIIILNDNFIKRSKLFATSDEQVFNVAAAVNTVIHEGRHAYQYYSVITGRTGLSYEQLLEWAATMPSFGGVYFNGSGDTLAALLYSIQGLEEDARRCARRKVKEINDFFRQNGIRDANYINEEIGDRNYEKMLIRYVRNYLNLDMLNRLEKSIVDHFREHNPEIDVSRLTLFDNARLILTHPEIKDLDQLLEMMDKNADQKLGLQDGEKMKLENRADRIAPWGGIAAKKKFP